MPTSHLNFTKKKRIAREHVCLRVKTQEVPSFSADLTLADYGLPPNAPIVVEAFAGWTIMRFPYGTVKSAEPEGPMDLTEFDTIESVRFRVKVLSDDEDTGRILAEADQLLPEPSPQEQLGKSFVLVRPHDLGSVPWQLEFDESRPVLLVNSAFSDWLGFTRATAFRGLVLPEVYRQLLQTAAEDEGDDETVTWQSQCLAIAEAHTGESTPTDADALQEWINNAVDAFARRHSLMRSAAISLGEDES
jgi:hypothetical protein